MFSCATHTKEFNWITPILWWIAWAVFDAHHVSRVCSIPNFRRLFAIYTERFSWQLLGSDAGPFEYHWTTGTNCRRVLCIRYKGWLQMVWAILTNTFM